MMQRHALVASYIVPQFDRDSGSRRTSDLIEHLLRTGWRVTYVAASSDGNDDPKYRRALQRQGVAVYDGIEAGEEVITSGGLDLALFSFWPVAELYLPWVREVSPFTAVIVDSVDVQLVRYVRRLDSLAAPGSLELLDADDADEIRGEINTYLAADAVLTVSQAEADLLTTLTGRRDLAFAVPDQEDIALAGPGFGKRRGLVFAGSFRWAPNIDAARFLVQEVLPLVDPELRAEHPLTLAGDGLDDAVLEAIGRAPHVVPVGWVPSLLPYLERARCAVIPLRYGAGTKRKTIQALAAGTPTVATSVGAEGLDLENGRHLLIADDAAALASAMERLLTDARLWRRLRQEGAAKMGATRSSQVAAASLAHVLKAVAERPVRPGQPVNLARGARASRYNNRQCFQGYQRLLPATRSLLDRHLPPGEPVLVVSHGQAGALRLGGPGAQHFPQAEDGGWRERPATTGEVVADLQSHAQRGVAYLLVPDWHRWFLDEFPGIDQALQPIDEAEGAAALYAIQLRPRSIPARPAAGARSDPNDHGAAAAPRLIAFYLPQFHPIPENDEWWGPGFSDWINVAKAGALFPGHAQPHVPGDLGVYDLRVPEVREAQAELAAAHGITAFCYYHYWFGGKRLLERPFDDVLASGEPDLPFTLCWANESWSRRWDGLEHDILQPQAYSPADDLDHIRSLIPALADHRAVTIGGRPLLTIYQAWALPDPARTATTWKEEVERAGLGELYLCTVETGWDADRDFSDAGFDAKIGFSPQFSILAELPRLPLGPSSLRVYDYDTAWRALAEPNPVTYRRFETVCPTWDNTARRGEDGWVLHGSTAHSYEEWLTGALQRAMTQPPDERLVFVNAWNEWAEGCHLEPDQAQGTAYLEATARALASVTGGAVLQPAATGRR